MRARYSIDDHHRSHCWIEKQRVVDWLQNEHLDCTVTAVEWNPEHPLDVTLTTITSDGSILSDLTAQETTRQHSATRPFPLKGRPVKIVPVS